jgi:hypothetical protein
MLIPSNLHFVAIALAGALAIQIPSARASCAAPPSIARLTAEAHAGGAIAARGAAREQAADGQAAGEPIHIPLMPGLWKFAFTAADGSSLDFGYNAFALGGTETLISFGRAPGTGDACIGLWKQVGERKVRVDHYAPIFADDNTTFLGTVIFRETLTLSSRGDSYSGPIDVTGYDTSGNILFEFDASASATRVTLGKPGE